MSLKEEIVTFISNKGCTEDQIIKRFQTPKRCKSLYTVSGIESALDNLRSTKNVMYVNGKYYNK